MIKAALFRLLILTGAGGLFYATDVAVEYAAPTSAAVYPQQIQEPPEYPPDEFCKRPDDVKTAKDHPCECRKDMPCTTEHQYGQDGPESVKCTQWCHKDHCACVMECE